MSDSHQRKVKSSCAPDFSDLEKFMQDVRAHEAKADEYHAAIRDYENLAASETKAKTDILKNSAFLTFLNMRFKEKSPPDWTFQIEWRNDGTLSLDRGQYIVDKNGLELKKSIELLDELMNALIAIGIPKEALFKKKGYHIPDDGKIELPAEFIYIRFDTSLIQSVIESAVDDRFDLIHKKYEEAAQIANNSLKGVSKLIEEATGHEVIDEHPERSLGFTDQLVSRIKDDIRRKVTDEVLGGLAAQRDISGDLNP